MYDKPFSEDMLVDGARIVVSCPEEDLEREFAALLTANGYTYPAGENIFKVRRWDELQSEFCYFINNKTVRRGRKITRNEPPWNMYRKCTFYGDDTEILEESFCTILRG